MTPAAPTLPELDRGMLDAALIVDRHGAKYLPHFLRLEHDVAEERESRDALSRVRNLLSSARA